MKNRSKNRRHQTAYEAPELEGEFLNESADSMLSVSDFRGNLLSTTTNDIDPMMLEEFNEDQGARYSRPLETSSDATKRVGASRRETPEVSEEAIRDNKRAQYHPEESRRSHGPKAEPESYLKLIEPYVASLKSRPYLLMFGSLLAGFAIARAVSSSSDQRR